MTDVFPVVVGTDGSVRAAAAVTQAAEEAVLRDLPLRLIYGFAPLYGYTGLDPTPPADILHACEEVLQAEVDRIRKAFPSLDVSSAVIVADPAVVLVEESKKATILFVGARGLGAVRRLLLGSVSTKAATYAKCPVIVVRGKAGDPNGPIVVGVSPEVGSNEAVEFAFTEARLRNKAVRVIQSQQHAAANYELLPETAIRAMVALRMDDVAKRSEEAFEKIKATYPDVEATLDVLNFHAVDALLDASDEASLIVVGKHGGGVLASRIMGSVTQGVLGSAPVVAVVPKD